jgi:hypothetical protein
MPAAASLASACTICVPALECGLVVGRRWIRLMVYKCCLIDWRAQTHREEAAVGGGSGCGGCGDAIEVPFRPGWNGKRFRSALEFPGSAWCLVPPPEPWFPGTGTRKNEGILAIGHGPPYTAHTTHLGHRTGRVDGGFGIDPKWWGIGWTAGAEGQTSARTDWLGWRGSFSGTGAKVPSISLASRFNRSQRPIHGDGGLGSDQRGTHRPSSARQRNRTLDPLARPPTVQWCRTRGFDCGQTRVGFRGSRANPKNPRVLPLKKTNKQQQQQQQRTARQRDRVIASLVLCLFV